jgi:hypothetical protein
MGRSLLGDSVFSRTSPALARTSTSKTPLLGRSLVPRFSRGKALTRLTGALRRSARPRSPGKGWLRRTSPRSGAIGRGAPGGGTLSRRAFKGSAFKGSAFKGSTLKGSTLKGSAFKSGGFSAGTSSKGGLRTSGPARLRMPRRRKAWKRSWRTGGYR